MRRILNVCLLFLYFTLALCAPLATLPTHGQPVEASKTAEEPYLVQENRNWLGLASLLVVGGLMIVLQHRSLHRIQQR